MHTIGMGFAKADELLDIPEISKTNLDKAIQSLSSIGLENNRAIDLEQHVEHSENSRHKKQEDPAG